MPNSEQGQPSSTGHPNIFSVNKKLNDNLAEIDSHFKTLEKSIELSSTNTGSRIDKIELRLNRIEDRNVNMEKILLQIQMSLNSKTYDNVNTKEVKDDLSLKTSKGKQKEPIEEVDLKLVKGKLKQTKEDLDLKASKGKQTELLYTNPVTSQSKDEKIDTIKRDQYGRIQLSDFAHNNNLSRGEMFVKRAWPEAIFPQDVQDDVYTSVKNKVVLKPEWRLVVANSEVFNKLTQIQNALQIALIPYHLWTKRVTMDMSGDFHAVRVWAIGRNPTWIELLEAIFTTMQRLNVLYSPFTKFSLLTPQKNESPHTFAWRLRDAFYQLSGQDSVGTVPIICLYSSFYLCSLVLRNAM
ncbi:hypothetical protein HI914_04835 [Erysiphe necator]|nr:hypothetical protein HI914_04835 [Erysiphe necator]